MTLCVFILYTQDDFVVWEGEATGKGKDRHLFLFENKLLLTRKRKSEQPGDLPTYEFRGMINVRFGFVFGILRRNIIELLNQSYRIIELFYGCEY